MFSRPEINTSKIFASAGMRNWVELFFNITVNVTASVHDMTVSGSASPCTVCQTVFYAYSMLAEAGTHVSIIKTPFLHGPHCTEIQFKAKLVLPWHTLNKPVHYVLRVGDKSRIERFVGIAFLPELFGELFAGHDCLLRICFHMCWDRDVLSAGYLIS